MKNNSKPLLSVVFLIGLSLNLVAQQSMDRINIKPSASKLIQLLDQNNDGMIDTKEANEASRGILSERFTEIDASKDGYLTLEELENSFKLGANKKRKQTSRNFAVKKNKQKATPKALFKLLDTNNDKKISKTEASESRRKKMSLKFEKFDVNEDGFISMKEFEDKLSKGHEGPLKEKKEAKENRTMNGQRPSPTNIMKMLDKNNDQQIDMEEARGAKNGKLAENFHRIDLDQNGTISIAELKELFNKRKRH